MDWIKELTHIESDMMHTFTLILIGAGAIFRGYRWIEGRFVENDDLEHIIDKQNIRITELNRRIDDLVYAPRKRTEAGTKSNS